MTSNLNLKFIHIPKNAGTSIEDWGRTYKFFWGRFDECPQDLPIVGKWHSPAKYWSKDQDYFCVVRHPYERLISSINFIYPEGVGDINLFLKENLEKMAREGKPIAFLPQYHYVYNTDTGEKVCKYILSFRNLTEDFKNMLIKEKCMYAYRDLPRSNITKIKKYKVDCLNGESLDLINKIYAKDFELIALKIH